MKYLIYLRVSTEHQGEDGLGVDAQRNKCMLWIERQKTNAEIYEYKEVVTGTDKDRKELEKRPKLLEALNDLQPGDALVYSCRDRLSRDPYINCMIERIVEKKQARLISADGSHEGNNPHDILMRRIIDAFAEYEALMISTRTKAALARKKARGERVGHIPYGKVCVDGKMLADNYDEISNLQYIINKWTEKKSTRWIAQEMNLKGIPARNGRLWTHGAVARLINNNV